MLGDKNAVLIDLAILIRVLCQRTAVLYKILPGPGRVRVRDMMFIEQGFVIIDSVGKGPVAELIPAAIDACAAFDENRADFMDKRILCSDGAKIQQPAFSCQLIPHHGVGIEHVRRLSGRHHGVQFFLAREGDQLDFYSVLFFKFAEPAAQVLQERHIGRHIEGEHAGFRRIRGPAGGKQK
ncbi:MAG: hypothetical protein BWY83_02108 [bacterium ADurb.Bin478]|nr:MAG: hypothetical protein BWY83_02108 [bacterium ADurb.Bin478]